MPFLVLLYTIFKLYGCSTRKRYFHILVLDFGHWSVRDYVPFRHQILALTVNKQTAGYFVIPENCFHAVVYTRLRTRFATSLCV